jgi:hypothetical protein
MRALVSIIRGPILTGVVGWQENLELAESLEHMKRDRVHHESTIGIA